MANLAEVAIKEQRSSALALECAKVPWPRLGLDLGFGLVLGHRSYAGAARGARCTARQRGLGAEGLGLLPKPEPESAPEAGSSLLLRPALRDLRTAAPESYGAT